MKEMSKMELRQLEYFAAVARLKNYTRAADEMYVSQPTIPSCSLDAINFSSTYSGSIFF